MRARTDRKESSRLMSKASKALERSSSASPGDEEDRRPPNPERYRSATAEDRGHQLEGPGRGERSPTGAERESPGVPPGARPEMGGGDSARSSTEELEDDQQDFYRRREERPGEGERSRGRFFFARPVPSLDERRRRLLEREIS